MAYSFEQIFHTEPKVVGMIEIYSNPMDRSTVRDIEKVIKEIAKSMRINLNNIPSGETLRVFIYPTKRIFYQFFGTDIEKNMRRKRSRSQEDMLFIIGEGEIHMVSPKASGMSYTDMIKILVKDILEEYGMEDKVKKAQDKVKEELEPEDTIEEIDDEEIEDIEEEKLDEPEELTEEEFDDLEEEIDYQIDQSEKPMPEWLDLGWIMYKRQILAITKNKVDFANFIKKNGVKSQNKIPTKQSVVGQYNYASESAAAIVEYIVESYGIRKIFDLIGEPDIKKAIGISEGKFKREYTTWVKKRYVSSKMQEISKDNVKEEKVKEKNEK